MKSVLFSLLVLLFTVVIASFMYYNIPTQCGGSKTSANIVEGLDNESTTLPYYKVGTSRPGNLDNYNYFNGIYCEKGDTDCKTYALTCTVGVDPNCHNYKTTDPDCYDSSGAYICNSNSNRASDFTTSLHNASGSSCQTISGELVCNGDAWGKGSRWYDYAPPADTTFKTGSLCEIVDNKLVCEEPCGLIDGEWVCKKNTGFDHTNSYTNPYPDTELSYWNLEGDDLPPLWKTGYYYSGLSDWGISTTGTTTPTKTVKPSWSNFRYKTQETPIMNYPLQYGDWNRMLASPVVDTKDYTANSDTLNKIYQTLYTLVSRDDCSQGIYGCCSDQKTKKSDFQGSNCPEEELSKKIKKYIHVEVTKTAKKILPPEGSSIANTESVSKKDKDKNKNKKDKNKNKENENIPIPPSFLLSSGQTDSSPRNPFSQDMPISSAMNPMAALSDTNVLPAQSSYTSTVFLAGPNGGVIGNCPEPSFECKKGNCKTNNLPMPLVADFSSFGM